VVRVVVPQLVPLSSRHAVRWLATPRLVDAAGGGEEARFHPHPHPFA
jgi:hypothetical protein